MFRLARLAAFGRRRIALALVGALAIGGVGVGVAAHAASRTSTSTASAAVATGQAPSALRYAGYRPYHVIHNPRLRHDVRAAVLLPPDARAARLEQIKTEALSGRYGPRVERRAERLQRRWQRRFDRLPPNLQADLEAMRADDPANRPADWQAIVTKALAGDYGVRIERIAEWLQAHR